MPKRGRGSVRKERGGRFECFDNPNKKETGRKGRGRSKAGVAAICMKKKKGSPRSGKGRPF